MNQREKNRILKLYNTPSYPGSFCSARKFRHSLLQNENINISEKALNAILQEDLVFKMTRVRPRNPNQRPIVANSVGVSAQVDTTFIELSLPKTKVGKKERYPFRKGKKTLKKISF